MPSKFEFGIDSMPFWRSWPGKSPKGPWPRFRSDESGIVQTPFGKRINGIPEGELSQTEAEARERLNRLEREYLADLAAVYKRLAGIDNPRLRNMVNSFLLYGMHAGDPPDLEEYAKATGNDSLEDAADELSVAGGFTETKKGIETGAIYFDENDLPEPPDDDDGPDAFIYQIQV